MEMFVRAGIVTEVDATKGMIKAELPEYGITTDWCSITTIAAGANTFVFMPEVNDQVVIAGLDEFFNECVCLGCIYSNNTTPKNASDKKLNLTFEDGTQLEYNISTKTLKIDAQGEINIKTNNIINIECENATIKSNNLLTLQSQNISINGDVSVNGSLNSTGNIISVGEVAASSGLIKLSTHIHTSPPSGGSTTPPLPT